MKKLSHLDDAGKARMVDVGSKPIQRRMAVAQGMIFMQEETLRLIRENQIKKGDVLTVAEIAGIQAAKRASELIPLCHPLQVTRVEVGTKLIDEAAQKGVEVTATVRCSGQTGVEMEALTAVSVALLTVYDMCKAVDKSMALGQVRLLEKKKE